MGPVNEFVDLISAWIRANAIEVIALWFVLVMLSCYLVQGAVIWSLLNRRGWIKRILHPSNFPKGSIWQQAADQLLEWIDRTPAPPVTFRIELSSPMRTYQLVTMVGSGDLCHVYQSQSEGQNYLIKAPRVRGCDGLLSKEQFVLRQLRERDSDDRYESHLPIPVETFRSKDRSYFVYAWSAGYWSAGDILKQHPSGVDPRHVCWMFSQVLDLLGFTHRSGWVHGAVFPPHLQFAPETHRVRLVGWTHAEPIHRPLRFGSKKFRAWYPPECRRREPVTQATDIYQAVRTMIWMSGGEPLSGSLPDHFPVEFRRLVQCCLADSAAQRPQDAWVLRDEFNGLVDVVYGTSQFGSLTLT